MDSLNLVLERGNAIAVDMMAKKINFWTTKDRIDNDLMLGKALEDESQVLELLFSCASNEVIHICVAEGKTMEDLIHESLKSLSGISQAKLLTNSSTSSAAPREGTAVTGLDRVSAVYNSFPGTWFMV